MTRTPQGRMKGKDVLGGVWDQDANKMNDVIKQIRKIEDEVSHHARKRRWCNWYNSRMIVTGCSSKADTHMRWGAGLWRGWKWVWRNHLRPLQSHDWWEEGLPAAWGGGGAGCRMAPRSSSPPRELESDAQTASPAREPTPGETRHSHTAPYTLREKTKHYTHTHTAAYTLRGAYSTHSFVRITGQRFRTPSNTCLNQRDKRKHSHRILHPNLTSTQLPNSYRVSACLYKRHYSIEGC